MPDEEVPIYFMRNKIYTKLHKALFTLKSTEVGVSFPNYKLELGSLIRLHSNQIKLEELQAYIKNMQVLFNPKFGLE